MARFPKFAIHGENDPTIAASIQPQFAPRKLSELNAEERSTALRELANLGWIDSSAEILSTMAYLNRKYLRLCPAKRLHKIPPKYNHSLGRNNTSERIAAATDDFMSIWKSETNEDLLLAMLSKFAERHIDWDSYDRAEKGSEPSEIEKDTERAFRKFDKLANCLNHIFEQFAINVVLTRSGLVPRQDERLMELVYTPTLAMLSNPRWKGVNADVAAMFKDYNEGRFGEAITKAHTAVHRFLQTLVGDDGAAGKGELGKLFAKAKRDQLIPQNRYTDGVIGVLQGYSSSERAEKSTAKPASSNATASDALLMMNVVMVLLQYCLQNTK
jgi:hypothetical protein